MAKKGKIAQGNEELAELLKKAYGNVSQVAAVLGVTRQSLWARVNKSKQLQQAIEEARETIVDLAERKLYKAVEAGMEWAVKRVLDSKRGVDRGWRPPTELRVEGRHEVSLGRIDEAVGRDILDRLKPKPAEE
jgi:hypothetical protein